ncbi:MAG: queuosine precursor transporter, partial [Candidatus Riflebacteria bacterium]|nr:queuosine precursor transporter [Candidatus Riflebacteria bacterium]
MNELLLILSVVFLNSLLLLMFKLFAKNGVYCFTVFATLLANIEVLILVNAFGIEMTLGNVLFATTFIATDILSETESKEAAKKSVNIGILTSISFMLLTSSWLLYTPSANDWAMPHIVKIFS